jgi:uracil-DNA glycosylase
VEVEYQQLMSRGVVEEERNGPVHVTNNVEKFYEVVHVFTPALCCSHLLGEKICSPLPVVAVKETLIWRHVLLMVFI